MDPAMDAFFESEIFAPLPDDGLDLDMALFNDDLFTFLGSGELPLTLGCLEAEENRPSTCPVASFACDNAPRGLAVQRCSGPRTKRKAAGPMRIVTSDPHLAEAAATTSVRSASPTTTGQAPDVGTEPAVCSQKAPAPLQASVPALKAEREALCSFVAAPMALATSSHSHIQDGNEDSDTDSDDSNDTEEQGLHPNEARANKRKAPDVDWRSIVDVAERRRQRRLAKNRVTAARSRERKKFQWSEMEAKLQALEKDNSMLKALMEKMQRENSSLRVQLTSLADGGVMAPSQGGKRPKADPAVAGLNPPGRRGYAAPDVRRATGAADGGAQRKARAGAA